MAQSKEPADERAIPAAGRPQQGLTAEEALQRWSDAADYAGMTKYSESGKHMTDEPGGMDAYLEYRRRRDALEAVFFEKLQHGRILASAVARGQDRREIVDPSLWDDLVVNHDLDSISGGGRVFTAAQFFEPNAIPLNIRELPDWLRSRTDPLLRHDKDYRHVGLGGENFTLGTEQAKVIRFLHEMSEAGDPWQHWKAIRHQSNVRALRIRDLFKKPAYWATLLESDRKGNYRLRIDGS